MLSSQITWAARPSCGSSRISRETSWLRRCWRSLTGRSRFHLSIVGGELMVRYQRTRKRFFLNWMLVGVHTQVVTSAFRVIPSEWMRFKLLTVAVSIDGLQPEHDDERRKPAAYERILKSICRRAKVKARAQRQPCYRGPTWDTLRSLCASGANRPRWLKRFGSKTFAHRAAQRPRQEIGRRGAACARGRRTASSRATFSQVADASWIGSRAVVSAEEPGGYAIFARQRIRFRPI